MTAAASFRSDAKVIGLVGVAHGLSHFFQLCLPPLFPLLKDEFGVSYAALGAVTAVFYAVSGVMQTAAGFLVDRLGARAIPPAGVGGGCAGRAGWGGAGRRGRGVSPPRRRWRAGGTGCSIPPISRC